MSENGVESRSRVCELEFRVHGGEYPFVSVSEEEDCTLALTEMFPRPDGRYAEFFNVRGTEPSRILERAGTHESVEASIVAEYDDGGLLEFVVSDSCPAFRLAELGALPREVEGRDGSGHIVAEVPPGTDESAVVRSFVDEYPDVEFAAKRRKDAVEPRFTRSRIPRVLRENLTERQYEVLRTAFERGYYDWPRGCTGEEIADDLEITSATFSEHITAAERNVLSALFAERDPEDADVS